jgi:hypothetical protein
MRGSPDLSYPALPVKVKSPRGFCWSLVGEQWHGAAERLERFFLPSAGTVGVQVLKHTFNRTVVRILPASEDLLPAVAKVFPMRSLRQYLYRWRRYAPSEAAKLLEAARRGLPVPAVYGLGLHRRWGLMRRSAVLMEDLAPLRPVGQLLRDSDGDAARQREIIMATVDVFVQMHNVGCCNLDINKGSVFLSEDLKAPARVVDFQYAWFVEEPDDEGLAYQAAHFSAWCLPEVSPGLTAEWAAALMERAGVADKAGWWRLYTQHASYPLTRRERMKLRAMK